MNKVKVSDVELAYRDEGSGEPIVFLHAFPLNQTMWDDQLSWLVPSQRVITFDWRGFGKSGNGQIKSSMTVFADDLAELLDHLKIEKITICGISMGGYATFAFFRKHSSRVRALILCDTRAAADSDEGKAGRYQMAELVRSKGTSVIVETMIPRLLGETTLQNCPQIVHRVRRMIEGTQPEGIAQALIGMAERGTSTDLLKLIDCPTLIIVGNEDRLTPPGEAKKMFNSISSAKLEVISNAGHLPNMEQPVIFNQIVSKFLLEL